MRYYIDRNQYIPVGSILTTPLIRSLKNLSDSCHFSGFAAQPRVFAVHRMLNRAL
jgi:hypothetical protein